jgi:hypothetical protein
MLTGPHSVTDQNIDKGSLEFFVSKNEEKKTPGRFENSSEANSW